MAKMTQHKSAHIFHEKYHQSTNFFGGKHLDITFYNKTTHNFHVYICTANNKYDESMEEKLTSYFIS